MCTFFSCCSNGRGKLLYFDAAGRAALRASNPKNYDPDSHTSIADALEYQGVKEDALNKYEFNPLTKKFTIDQINTKDDSAQVEKALLALDFKTIVPQLIVKPIINPFSITRGVNVSNEELSLFREWIGVGGSVVDSVGGSVRDSVRDSVGDSVGGSVWDSVWDSVRGYYSSFFMIPCWRAGNKLHSQNPFQCVATLWESGLVSSFDGKKWRLHAGPEARIVWEGETS